MKNNNSPLLTVAYLTVVTLFIIYYGSFPLGFNLHLYLFEHIGQFGLILLNISLFLFFIFFINFRQEINWKGTGVYTAFMISLFTEMFGIPLVVYFFSSSTTYPILKSYFPFNHIDLRYVFQFDPINVVFCSFGMIFLLLGMTLIYKGWRGVYREEGFNSNGVYRYIRHPQYAGLLMITFSWAVVWPTLLTWIMWPFLFVIYFNQARREEKKMSRQFGEEFKEYMRRTKLFVPGLL